MFLLLEQLRKNLKPTVAYCSMFWMFGMCAAFLGPTLLDLGVRIHETIGMVLSVVLSSVSLLFLL